MEFHIFHDNLIAGIHCQLFRAPMVVRLYRATLCRRTVVGNIVIRIELEALARDVIAVNTPRRTLHRADLRHIIVARLITIENHMAHARCHLEDTRMFWKVEIMRLKVARGILTIIRMGIRLQNMHFALALEVTVSLIIREVIAFKGKRRRLCRIGRIPRITKMLLHILCCL